uniref:Uncharacterized protein n=1 Tax=Leptospira ellisii TaxID=2023197 RepID=A0A2N0B3K5_9LEPT|nr:hypothetical protein CH379_20665 [Leptospira ellisii]
MASGLDAPFFPNKTRNDTVGSGPSDVFSLEKSYFFRRILLYFIFVKRNPGFSSFAQSRISLFESDHSSVRFIVDSPDLKSK